MISTTKDQKQTFWSRMDQLNIPEAQSMTDSLVENQLMFKMTSEPEGWILGSIWGLRESATYWINRLKMIMTRYAIKITRLMGLIILQASKNFKSQRLHKVFGRSNSILKTFVKRMNNWGWADTRQVWGLICRGIHVAKNCKAVGTKCFRNNRENFGVSCNNKINGEWLYQWQMHVVIHRGLSMEGNCNSDGTKSRENIIE